MTASLFKGAAVAAAALVLPIGMAQPASAEISANRCASEQRKELTAWGLSPNVFVYVCVQRDHTGPYRANVEFNWGQAGDNDYHYVQLHSRLEKYDVVQKGAVCDITSHINSAVNGSRLCQTVWTPGTPGQMTADFTVVYDVVNDGMGEYRLDFTGSPAI
ncbi:hypothetical protein [Streptomyces sp. NBC_00443]|uniref:hypothetical protein n=1 Tax=Streptomyces sp. NBC_00443 TaxID=2975743 RepID=UPI002E24B259